MEEAVRLAVQILNDKIKTNKLHDGEFTLVDDYFGSIGLYYTDKVRKHKIALVITRGGGYDFFYAQLITALVLAKTCVYESPNNGALLEIYNVNELMRCGTYEYERKFEKVKVL